MEWKLEETRGVELGMEGRTGREKKDYIWKVEVCYV